ncbi:PQQ-dependent sugar dehydrogenase [Fulvivirgaceae bacterium PWU4]|uniref:PQQ-dependent sugar dehydrogenase n=1 Tax=Chryseosolibacter histidini TaxID=2782349 RepID=A0AAP2GKU6_9BACT|nr:PQQ-dependent sugar dehydrogenase [Chryseosolibacter histidini]MBT1699414.1 PQQ-dependent sugar dehydrogenase [Chryseosolibacter histidini]
MQNKILCWAVLAVFVLASFAPVSDPIVAQEDVSLQLPQGFQATTIIPELGRNRHLVVQSNGDIYVKLDKLKDGAKGIVILRDANKDGQYEIASSFGDYAGTGIAIKNGYLYASSDDQVFRYKLNKKGEVENTDKPEIIVTGLVKGRQHQTKSIALDNAGNIYVNIGAPSNACQEQDRSKGSPGQDPCPILETAGGIWQFRADKLNQSYAEGTRYATGIRNVVGLDWNAQANELYAMQHGRDQFFQLYPEMYTEQQSAELPAEELFMVKKGSNFGWPYCYYDQYQKKKILAPEYGGDSKKQGRCEGVDQPVMAFPGHWAPNGLLFYTGKMFPSKYKNGAFIAFHGSWNRAPLEQQGYKVVFVPFGKDGKPSGDYEVFANGFAGAGVVQSPRDAKFRPCGLAQGPDGALYISDSVKGRIWKIVYKK